MWDAKRPVLPFDEDGNMLGYSFDELTEEDVDKCYNYGKSIRTYKDGHMRTEFRPFNHVLLGLRYVNYSRGHSSVKFIYEDDNKHRYEMFVKDIHELLIAKKDIHFLCGNFTAVKRGANYGIVFDNMESCLIRSIDYERS